VESTLIIVEKDFVPVVVLGELQSFVNQVGEIDIKPLTVIKDFANNKYSFSKNP